MRRSELLMSLALLAGGLALLRQAARLPIAWTGVGPGAGFFPFWLSFGVTILAVIILVQSLRSGADGNGKREPFIPAGAWKPLLVMFLPIVAVIIFLPYLGLYVGGTLYLAGYMWLVGRHRWTSILLVSVVVPLTLFLIFERWFLLPMPKGAMLEYLLYGR